MGKRIPLEVRLWAKVNKNGPVPDYAPHLGPCWLWTAHRSSHGYGRVGVDGKGRQAHRVVYELLVGPIPDGMQLDHLCRVRHCVNPAHVEPVTPRENYRRGFSAFGVNARKTECPQGHPYDEANTYFTPGGGRKCRACMVEDQRELRRSRGAGIPSAERTHCPQGHPYDEANTVYEGTQRRCRECRREQMRNADKKRTGRRRKPGAVTNAIKTHCPQGHLYDEVNTKYAPDGSRKCRTCLRERDRARSGRKRKAA